MSHFLVIFVVRIIERGLNFTDYEIVSPEAICLIYFPFYCGNTLLVGPINRKSRKPDASFRQPMSLKRYDCWGC